MTCEHPKIGMDCPYCEVNSLQSRLRVANKVAAAAQLAYEYLSGVALCDSNSRERIMYEDLQRSLMLWDRGTAKAKKRK